MAIAHPTTTRAPSPKAWPWAPTVRQGQVIGYVGSTGQSTGNHLHYEMIVNGRKVDPTRVRLPDSKSLKGEELEAFQRERSRIDELLKDSLAAPSTVAAKAS